MRGVVVTKVGVEKQKKNNLLNLFRKYLYKPITGGVFGYLIFLFLISVSKYLGYLIGNRESFQIDITDLLLSLLGFAFIFTIKMKENTKEKVS
ncbi:MAG: hypothetical protein EHM47_02870 [Ignavibacteriales bacterium]|nr:MAG: hypothetical protein EHM47_02870 [Ignavibacteriales bacterium]